CESYRGRPQVDRHRSLWPQIRGGVSARQVGAIQTQDTDACGVRCRQLCTLLPCRVHCVSESGHDETGPPNAISAFDCRRCRAARRHTKRRYRRRSMRRRWIWPGCEKKEIQRAPLEQLTEPGTHTRLGLASPPSIQKEEPMNRFGVLSLCAVTGLGLALLSDTALGQQKSLKEQIVGSWSYASADTIRPDGSRVPTWGSNYSGLVIFGADV